MKVYSQLISAQVENKASDYSATVVGRIWWNTATLRIMSSDGSLVRAILRNDQKCIFGNSVTASQNIRFHRGAANVLQFVTGDDATAEGTLSTNINQISARVENYTTGTLPTPAIANKGRLAYDTTLANIAFDNGGTWIYVASGATTSRVASVWNFVLGSAAQVTSGAATHSTWASVIAAASATDTIKVLAGAWTENVTIDRQLNISGNGYGSNLTGTITFTSAATRSVLKGIRISDNITLAASANLIKVEDIWFAAGKTFIDNGTGNLVEGFQE